MGCWLKQPLGQAEAEWKAVWKVQGTSFQGPSPTGPVCCFHLTNLPTVRLSVWVLFKSMDLVHTPQFQGWK